MSDAGNPSKTDDPRKLEFYDVDASVIDDSARELLHKYSGVPEDQIASHVDTIWPYPCIGMYRFLDLSLPSTSIYSEVLSRVKDGEQFLDLGCCFGQEIRKLVFDGAPASNTYGSDLRADFIELGYDLFNDKDRLQTTFVPADVFDDTSELTKLAGKINIVYTGAFFHLFAHAEQEAIATRIVQLLAPTPGSLVIGRQMGNENAREFGREGYGGEQKRFRHNKESWRELWGRVGEKTGSKWQVDVQLDETSSSVTGPEVRLNIRRAEPGARRLAFVVRRL